MIDFKQKWIDANEDIRYLLKQLDRIEGILYNTSMSNGDKITFIEEVMEDDDTD